MPQPEGRWHPITIRQRTMSVPIMKTFAKFRGAGGRITETGEVQRSVRSRIWTIRTSEHTRPIENKAKMLEILDDNSARPAIGSAASDRSPRLQRDGHPPGDIPAGPVPGHPRRIPGANRLLTVGPACRICGRDLTDRHADRGAVSALVTRRAGALGTVATASPGPSARTTPARLAHSRVAAIGRGLMGFARPCPPETRRRAAARAWTGPKPTQP